MHHLAGHAVVLLHSRGHSAEDTGQQWQKAHLVDWAAITLQISSCLLRYWTVLNFVTYAVEAMSQLMSWPGLIVHVTHI